MSLHDLECIKPILIEQFDDFWNFNILEQNFNNINSIYFVAKSEEGDSFGEKNNEPDTILGFVGLLDTPIDIEEGGPMMGVLFRTAKHERDFHGGINHFASLKEFPNRVFRDLEREFERE